MDAQLGIRCGGVRSMAVTLQDPSMVVATVEPIPGPRAKFGVSSPNSSGDGNEVSDSRSYQNPLECYLRIWGRRKRRLGTSNLIRHVGSRTGFQHGGRQRGALRLDNGVRSETAKDGGDRSCTPPFNYSTACGSWVAYVGRTANCTTITYRRWCERNLPPLDVT